jgi:hypothetical protein
LIKAGVERARLGDVGSSGDLGEERHKHIKEDVLDLEHPMYDPKDSDDGTSEKRFVDIEVLIEALNAINKIRQQACLKG